MCVHVQYVYMYILYINMHMCLYSGILYNSKFHCTILVLLLSLIMFLIFYLLL